MLLVVGIAGTHAVRAALRNPCEKDTAYVHHLVVKYGDATLTSSTPDEGLKTVRLHEACCPMTTTIQARWTTGIE
jgi:hypothetical protein